MESEIGLIDYNAGTGRARWPTPRGAGATESNNRHDSRRD